MTLSFENDELQTLVTMHSKGIINIHMTTDLLYSLITPSSRIHQRMSVY